ncbi:MAG: D-alanine--D-alanine ligase [Pseudomonadota bacterium]
MSSRTLPRVAVLMGGPSAERDVSLVSGRECAQALRRFGYDVTPIDAGADLPARLAESGAEIAFNALHGRWGEDGCVQGVLEWLGIAYTHSGVLASALAMDKIRTKAVYAAHDLPVVAHKLSPREEVAARHPMAPPYVVKPYNEGSSVGVYIVSEGANGPARLAADAPEILMVEQFVPGRELTVSVMGAPGAEQALAVTDIVANQGWYDYHAKYADGGSTHIVPADIPDEIAAAARAHAITAHRALGCRGLSRTDFRWDETHGLAGLVLLETNTQPGMTPTSLAPEQAAHIGMDFEELCDWLVRDASCGR